MNRKLFSVLLFSFSLGIGSANAQNFARKVNTLIGTDYTGNTYPGAQAPFGMVQLSPDNGLPGWDRIAGYFYPDSTIAGFSHTHLSWYRSRRPIRHLLSSSHKAFLNRRRTVGAAFQIQS